MADTFFIIIVILFIGMIPFLLGMALANKRWNINYEENSIIVKNTLFGAILLINNEIHDQASGFAISRNLFGEIDGQPLKIKISDGFAGLRCRLYVDNQQIELKRLY